MPNIVRPIILPKQHSVGPLKKAVEEEEKRAAEAKAEKEKFRAAVEEKNAKATEEDVN